MTEFEEKLNQLVEYAKVLADELAYVINPNQTIIEINKYKHEILTAHNKEINEQNTINEDMIDIEEISPTEAYHNAYDSNKQWYNYA